MLDAEGQNLSMQAAEQQGVIPKPMAGRKLAQAMLAAPGFTVGTKGPLFTVFLDPNCIFCHDFWNKVYPLAEAGKLRFKVVPVGFLKPSSLPKAVTILQSKDPVAAWAQNEASFNVKTEEGGAKPAKVLDPKVLAEVKANTELLARTGEVATPTIVACLKGDQVPQVFHGMAPGMMADLGRGASIKGDGTCS
uniref:thioredoxin fold domain-containing protein n=1 Tax=Acidithiobacillus caldus TaxID=33059 RepID=UPI001EEA153A|nr:thioredoxin fold domain-containing protein [Acidithiobacillus caldus]